MQVSESILIFLAVFLSVEAATTKLTLPTDVAQENATVEGCHLPEFPYDERYRDSNNHDRKIVPGDTVLPFTELVYSCKKDNDLTWMLSVCQKNNTWSPEPECHMEAATTNLTLPTDVAQENATVEGCHLPDFPYDGRYTVSIDNNRTIVPGDIVPLFTVLVYSCNKDYDLTDRLSVCQEDNTWSSKPECERRCTTPTSLTVDFACYSPAGAIPCSPTLPSGSTIFSRCKDGLITLDELLVLTCRDGSWDNATPECTPDCGLEKEFGVSHIVHGTTVKKDTFPWHVAIYQDLGNPVPDQICGGSLVRANVVISAAHCFYDPVQNKPIDAHCYKVAGGKFHRSWDNEADNRFTYVQKTKVRQIILHENYKGDEENHYNDIAIVVLATPFNLSDYVRPVCVDLNSQELDAIQVGPGRIGKVAGWGTTETGRPSEEPRLLKVPVVSAKDCRLEMDKYNFTRYLTVDKLCAGYANGSALCRGGAGGGLVFPIQDITNRTRWYLRGVVSNGPLADAMTSCQTDTYTTYTEIFKQREWLAPQLRLLTKK